MSGATSPIDLQELGGDDAAALQGFSCRTFREPWSDLVEEMIRGPLPDALADGNVEGVGAWVEGRLSGVAAWRFDDGQPRYCHCFIVAVRTGARRRGIGRALKQAVLARATAIGAAAVVSEVHWDNDAMIELNVQLGANVEQIDGDPEYLRCIIALPPLDWA